MRRASWLLCLSLVAAGGSPPAPPPLAEARGDLDGDGRPERVVLERDGTLRVMGPDGAVRAQRTLAPATSGAVSLPTVEGVALVHARAALAGGRAVELVARLGPAGLEPIYEGPTGPVGDGDRSEHLRVEAGGLERWQRSPTVRRCDGEERLFRQRYDFARARFVPAAPLLPDGPSLAAAAHTPAGVGTPPLGAFHFMAASSGADAEGRADRLGAPRELDDAEPATVWAGDAGDWAAARALRGGLKLRAIRILPGRGAAPRALRLVLDGGRVFRVELPGGGGAAWVAMPDGPPTACVAVVLDEPGALAEVAIYTDAEGAGGLERLVDDIATERAGADGAAQLVIAHGAAAVPLVDAALARRPPGRRRLVQVLSSLQAPEAAPVLARALATSSAEESGAIVDGLVALGDAGARAAAPLCGDPAQAPTARAEAAAALARLASAPAPSPPAVAALLDVPGDAPPAVRAAARAGLAAAGARDPATVDALAARLAAAGADEEHAADLARALGRAGHGSARRAVAADALVHALGGAQGFPLRLALRRAMGDLGDPRLAAPLDAAARDPDEVLRAAAVQAAGALDGDAGRATARRAVGDADPAVRRAAVTAVRDADPDLLVARVAGDGWPMVRQAAVEGLGAACAARAHTVEPALIARVQHDASEEVRRAALGALPHCPGSHRALLVDVLADHAQPIPVRELAAALLAKSGERAAAKAIAGTLEDVLADPAADERSIGLAVSCARALGRLGDTSRPVLEALGAAANEPLSGAVRAGALEAVGQLCPEGAGEALAHGAADPDPAVRRAAAEAQRRCHR
jgi:hypothetical protein